MESHENDASMVLRVPLVVSEATSESSQEDPQESSPFPLILQMSPPFHQSRTSCGLSHQALVPSCLAPSRTQEENL